MAIDHALEELMATLGDFGRYQGFQFFLHILSAVTAGLHMLSLVTIAAVPDHRCFIDGIDTNSSVASWNSTEILQAIPIVNGKLDSCHMFIGGSNETTTCTQYVYDNTFYEDTRAMDWNMVCDNRYRGAIAQTIYMLGVFTGAVTLGGLADKIGRKKVFCWSATLQLILGVGVAFVPEYFSFLFVRYLYGIFGSAGSYITGFVLTMELVGPSKRTPCGVAFQAAFAGGIMLVAGWGALIKSRQLLQVIYGLHGLLLFAHWWLMDESPRWLWMEGRQTEAINIVAKGVKKNGKVSMKFIQPLLEFSYIKVFGQNEKFQLPPTMAIPNDLMGEFVTYIVESMIRSLMLCTLMGTCILFIVTCLHICTQFKILAVEFENLSTDNDEKVLKCINRHQELLTMAKLLNEMFGPYFFANCCFSFINLSIMLFSLIINASLKNYLMEFPVVAAGMSQLFLVLWFGDRLTDATECVSNATYRSDWVGKSVKHQKMILFVIERAQKGQTLNVGGNFFYASIYLFSQICQKSWGAFNIMRSTYSE